MKTDRPPILYGAVALAALSLAWSGYAITDLMHSGKFGLSVALAGDIGWITVLWAEYKGITLAGRRWAPTLAGWLIAVGVALLLVIHGHEAGGRAQAIAGPFVVAVGKIVWAFALAAMKDTTAPTPEQQAEIDAVIRESSYKAQLHDARADAEIARIRAEARTTLARDEADFEVTLERIHKRAELNRRTPLALTAGRDREEAEQPIEVAREAPPVITTALPPKTFKRQPPAAPAGPYGEVVADVSVLFGSAHAPVVYFLRNGTRVKIGTSQNLRRRITSLSLRREDVVRVEHGDQQYERELHRRFESLRVDETEWFELRGSLAEYLGLLDPDTASGRPDEIPDTDPDTSGREAEEPEAVPLTSPDARPDSPDPLSEIAQAATGPAELVRSLAAHGIPKDALVSEAVRLRPDMVADSIRRTAKRLGEGPYL
ncbi:GIY-YIG nuclease family protein [Streptomyces canus]|uniref:GIY-YIG nuclease family protein n=1 Tax=Streptomyces canus TaxID=58343 RepID=UPI0036B0EB07